jgi:uncharacterized protein (TIRG00374 family)
VVAVGLGWVILSRLPEFEQFVQTLARGQWQWVLAAAVLQGAFYAIHSQMYRAAFETVGVNGRTRDLLTVLIASYFVNTLAPSGGIAGSALFVDDAARRGQSSARAAAGAVLARIADSAAFAAVLAVGFAYLFLQHDLKPYEITGAVLLLAGTIGVSAALLLSLSGSGWLPYVLAWMQRGVNRSVSRLGRPSPLAAGWADAITAEFVEAGSAIRARPRRLLRTIGLALVGHVIDLASLYALFLAFHRNVGFGLLAASYGVGILFWKMSPIPEGVGVVEGAMVLVMTSLHVPIATATVVTLAFRGLTFWLPLVLGFFALRRLRLFQGEQAPKGVP